VDTLLRTRTATIGGAC